MNRNHGKAEEIEWWQARSGGHPINEKCSAKEEKFQEIGIGNCFVVACFFIHLNTWNSTDDLEYLQ